MRWLLFTFSSSAHRLLDDCLYVKLTMISIAFVTVYCYFMMTYFRCDTTENLMTNYRISTTLHLISIESIPYASSIIGALSPLLLYSFMTYIFIYFLCGIRDVVILSINFHCGLCTKHKIIIAAKSNDKTYCMHCKTFKGQKHSRKIEQRTRFEINFIGCENEKKKKNEWNLEIIQFTAGTNFGTA